MIFEHFLENNFDTNTIDITHYFHFFSQMWNMCDSYPTPTRATTFPLMSMLWRDTNYTFLSIGFDFLLTLTPNLWCFNLSNLWAWAQAVTCSSVLLPMKTKQKQTTIKSIHARHVSSCVVVLIQVWLQLPKFSTLVCVSTVSLQTATIRFTSCLTATSI